MRRLLPVLAVLLVTIAGVAGASALAPSGDTGPHDPEPSNADVEPDGNRPATYRLADDPDGGLGWGLRIYRSATGKTCPNAGRVDGEGRFGRSGDDGRLVELPAAPDGACADLREHPVALAIRRYAGQAGQPARGLVFGVVADASTEVLLRCDGRGDQRLDTSRRGAFLAVSEDGAWTGCSLTVTPASGDERTYALDG